MKYFDDHKAFIDWLSSHDPDESYRYSDCNNCLLAQWLKHNGVDGPLVGSNFWTATSKPELTYIPWEYNKISHGYRYTFGEALERAKGIF